MNEMWKRVRALDTNGVFGGDKVIWMLLFLLTVISVVEVYSASSNMTYKTGHFWAPVLGHLVHIAFGWLAAIGLCRMPCGMFKLVGIGGLPFSALLLLYAMAFGEKVNGAGRWVAGFQPSEIAKGVLVICIAMILSITYNREEGRVSRRGFKMCIAVAAVLCGLILPENLSTAAMTFGVTLMIMFVGRADWRWLTAIVSAIGLSGALFITMLTTAPEGTLQSMSNVPGLHRLPTWAHRVRSAGSGEENPATLDIQKNLQVVHAKIAVATSGILGKGPGNSVQRDYLPQSYADFIFAIIVEELGLVGGCFVVLLYIILLFRAGVIASRCERRFPALLCMGLALLIVTQAMINICVCVGLFPVTGQQLPLVSRGGTGMILNCMYIGMILSVSRNAAKAKKYADTPELLETNDTLTTAIPDEDNN